MRYWVDPWDPSYAPAAEGDGGLPESSAQLDLEVEVPPAAWAPMSGPPDVRAPDTVLLVDGVRRVDARVWTSEPEGHSHLGLAASYAAGVVRCDLRRGVAEVVAAKVERGLFTASPRATALTAGQIRYDLRQVDRGEPQQLLQAVQRALTGLEVQVATAAREAGGAEGALLVVDGPLRDRTHLRQAIGYIKTHRSQYLPPELISVVTGLGAGQRTPVFRLGTSWNRFTWYLRLPGATGAPWSGVVRAECASELPPSAAIARADLSVVTLPRFASHSYKDPRAPQNLIAIGGLERRLRSLLGDAALLHRALVRAAVAEPTGPGAG